jgi:hypothetical protein
LILKLSKLSQEVSEISGEIEILQRDQQPRLTQREALLKDREVARQQAASQEADVEARLREVQQLQDQLLAKV